MGKYNKASGINNPSKRRDYKTPTSDAIRDTYYEIKTKNYKESDDTILRKNVHNTIDMMLDKGRGKIEILVFLNNEYPECSISKFFESYISDHMKKKGIEEETR